MPYKDKEKQKEYARQWVAKRRAEYFADKTCIKCGSIDKLELDHIDPSIKVTHRIWSWSQQRREAEIAKCQILCEDCHQEKTNRDFKAGHGTFTMYKKNKCRCAICLKWKSTVDHNLVKLKN